MRQKNYLYVVGIRRYIPGPGACIIFLLYRAIHIYMRVCVCVFNIMHVYYILAH